LDIFLHNIQYRAGKRTGAKAVEATGEVQTVGKPPRSSSQSTAWRQAKVSARQEAQQVSMSPDKEGKFSRMQHAGEMPAGAQYG
jgi:hypothetical protein